MQKESLEADSPSPYGIENGPTDMYGTFYKILTLACMWTYGYNYKLDSYNLKTKTNYNHACAAG